MEIRIVTTSDVSNSIDYPVSYCTINGEAGQAVEAVMETVQKDRIEHCLGQKIMKNSRGNIMKKYSGIFIFLIIMLVACNHSSPVKDNTVNFNEKILTIHSDEIILTEITSFGWDSMYCFPPYISKKTIEKVIGFKSNLIIETVSEDMVQLIFVKDNKIVCNPFGYSEDLKYKFESEALPSEYWKINSGEAPVFAVKNANGIMVLTRITDGQI